MSVTHLRNNTIWRKKEHYFISLLKNIINVLQKCFQVVLKLLMGKEYSYNYVCKYLSKVVVFFQLHILIFNMKLNILDKL